MAAPRAESRFDDDVDFEPLLDAIYRTYHHDFRGYSPASLQRRIAHALTQFRCRSVAELQTQIVQKPEAFTGLLQYLTVSVSAMFRDPVYFQALREHVLPVLRTYASPKVWIAGCSTGEEVYSMAILLREEGLLDRTVIYATDINTQALEQAQQGIFPLDSIRAYTENYQRAGGTRAFSDYYTAAYDGALFDPTLKKNIIFADHSLATDSVFAETQLISCRNVMIYFNRALQDRAVGLFRDSLCRKGFLGLGAKETVDFSAHAAQFEPLVKTARIFRKTC